MSRDLRGEESVFALHGFPHPVQWLHAVAIQVDDGLAMYVPVTLRDPRPLIALTGIRIAGCNLAAMGDESEAGGVVWSVVWKLQLRVRMRR